MLSLPDAAAIRAALDQPLDGKLHEILREKLASIEAHDLETLTHIIVVQPRDTEDAIEHEIGWSPLLNPVDKIAYGSMGFVPYWAWLQDFGGWYELIHTIGNGGFAYLLLIEDAPGVPADLLRMCRQYAGEAG